MTLLPESQYMSTATKIVLGTIAATLVIAALMIVNLAILA